jgi:hypothetical protein
MCRDDSIIGETMERYIQLFKEYRIIRKNLSERFEKQVKEIIEELKFYTDVMVYLKDNKEIDFERISSLSTIYYLYKMNRRKYPKVEIYLENYFRREN